MEGERVTVRNSVIRVHTETVEPWSDEGINHADTREQQELQVQLQGWKRVGVFEGMHEKG